MPSGLHACLDTNIPFRYITQGQPGCEAEHLVSLREFVEQSLVTLIVPEVVLLELEKLYRDYEKELAVQFGKVEKHFNESADKLKIWNEATDLIPFLKSQFHVWKDAKLKEARPRHDEVQALLNSDHVVRLPYDEVIQFRAKRRLMAGRVANTDGKVEADCCILESIIRHFESRGEADELLFCTENWKDFGTEVKSGKFGFHPLMREGLPTVELMTTLASLVAFVEERKPVVEPAPQEVEEALERDKKEEIEKNLEAEKILQEIRSEFSIFDYKRRLEALAAAASLGPSSIAAEGVSSMSGIELLRRAASYDPNLLGRVTSAQDTFAASMARQADLTKALSTRSFHEVITKDLAAKNIVIRSAHADMLDFAKANQLNTQSIIDRAASKLAAQFSTQSVIDSAASQVARIQQIGSQLSRPFVSPNKSNDSEVISTSDVKPLDESIPLPGDAPPSGDSSHGESST